MSPGFHSTPHRPLRQPGQADPSRHSGARCKSEVDPCPPSGSGYQFTYETSGTPEPSRRSDMTGIHLRGSGQEAEVSTVGGLLTRYEAQGTKVLAGEEDPERYAYRSSLLAPWPNRVAEGTWTWEGETLNVPVNEEATGAALHGLVALAPFEVETQSESRVTLTHHLAPSDGYPFELLIRAGYALTPDGLVSHLEAVNLGDRPAPVGLGVHPYVDAPGGVDGLGLKVPADLVLLTDEQWRSRGLVPVEQEGVDYRTTRAVGEAELDTAFTGLVRDGDGKVRSVVTLPSGQEVTMWGGETCRWVLVYTGHTLSERDHRKSVAVEPMTCPPNALQTGEIDVVSPGETLRLDWGYILT